MIGPMGRGLWIGCALLSACASAPEHEGPQPLGHGAQVFKGQGELRINYEYEAIGPRDMVFFVDISEHGGEEVGDVELAVDVEGFDVLDGELRWTAKLPANATERREIRLRAQAEGAATVTITSRHASAVETVSKTPILFRVHEEEDIRPCRSTDEECEGR
jgi:hypothetical protein